MVAVGQSATALAHREGWSSSLRCCRTVTRFHAPGQASCLAPQLRRQHHEPQLEALSDDEADSTCMPRQQHEQQHASKGEGHIFCTAWAVGRFGGHCHSPMMSRVAVRVARIWASLCTIRIFLCRVLEWLIYWQLSVPGSGLSKPELSVAA